MLFAVEGGGFFSSSASGYSKGLALLILGHKSDEKHMRVAPWNQYQLVDQETKSDLQLASDKNQLSRGFASFTCFGRTSAGVDGQLPPKVNTTQPPDILPSVCVIESEKDLSPIVDYDTSARDICLRSSMKKSSQNILKTSIINDEHESFAEEDGVYEGLVEKRRIQWTDACGKELAEIREFEVSERGESDDEFANGNGKSCSCKIM